MKTRLLHLVATIAIAMALSGCGTTGSDNASTCDRTAAIYETYLAANEAMPGRVVSDEERQAAIAAGLFLRLNCGWSGPKGTTTTDANGVEIVYPPH